MQQSKILLLKFAFLLCSLPALAQGGGSITVSGVVTSAEDKAPLVGVHVLSGSTSGVSTLGDGSYSIVVAPGTVLSYHYIGFKVAEFTVPEGTAKLTHNVELQPEAQALDDVVVIAYGVRKKGTITGSVSTVKAEKVESTPTAAFDQALQGQVPGLTVMSNTGEPSVAATFTIRGTNSINSGTAPCTSSTVFPSQAPTSTPSTPPTSSRSPSSRTPRRPRSTVRVPRTASSSSPPNAVEWPKSPSSPTACSSVSPRSPRATGT